MTRIEAEHDHRIQETMGRVLVAMLDNGASLQEIIKVGSTIFPDWVFYVEDESTGRIAWAEKLAASAQH